MTFNPPSYNCPKCPRLLAFHESNRVQYPSFYNGPVPSFGSLDAKLLVVGLAPGLKGANQTGRPFTGDYAGIILYSAVQTMGFAEGKYDPEKFMMGGTLPPLSLRNNSPARSSSRTPPVVCERGHDSLRLINCRITNAVRCVPPENKPEPSEIKHCNGFLAAEIAAMPNLNIIITLGQIAHKAVVMAYGQKQSAHSFGHGNEHQFGAVRVINSYHCSRYNINTGVLTQAMFDAIVKRAKSLL